MEEMSYVFLFNFVFHCPLIFTLYWWPLAFLILSPPLQDFHVVLSKNNVSSVFYFSLQTSVALFLVELRWPAAYFLSFSVFLLLYIPNLLQQEKKKTCALRCDGKKKDDKRNAGDLKKKLSLKKIPFPSLFIFILIDRCPSRLSTMTATATSRNVNYLP